MLLRLIETISWNHSNGEPIANGRATKERINSGFSRIDKGKTSTIRLMIEYIFQCTTLNITLTALILSTFVSILLHCDCFVLFMVKIPTLDFTDPFLFSFFLFSNVCLFVCFFFPWCWESFYTLAFVYVSWANIFLMRYNPMDILLCAHRQKKTDAR